MRAKQFEQWLLTPGAGKPKPALEDVADWFFSNAGNYRVPRNVLEGARRWILWCLEALSQ